MYINGKLILATIFTAAVVADVVHAIKERRKTEDHARLCMSMVMQSLAPQTDSDEEEDNEERR
jgi:hypothetical protein